MRVFNRLFICIVRFIPQIQLIKLHKFFMAILKILQYPDDRLHTIATEVLEVTKIGRGRVGKEC